MSTPPGSRTREAILDAARRRFETEGYHAVGLATVAAEAGVSRQAIYLHFDSKPALLRALHERIHERDVAPAMAKVWACPDASTALDTFVSSSAAAVGRMFAIFTALDAARLSDAEVEASWQPGKEGRYTDCLRLARWLEQDGLLAPAVTTREAADVLWSLTNLGSYQTLVVDRSWSVRRWVAWVTRTLRTGLLG